MTDFISPFEKRSFWGCIRATFSFLAQNSFLILGLLLPFLLIFSFLVLWLGTLDEKLGQINYSTFLWFIPFSVVSLYVAHQGNLLSVKSKEVMASLGSAFCKMFIASFVVFVALAGPLFFLMVISGMFKINSLYPIILFALYLIVLIPYIFMYYCHCCFSSKYSDFLDSLEASFKLVKGHWWITFGYLVLVFLFTSLLIVLFSLLLVIICPDPTFVVLVLSPISLLVEFASLIAVIYHYGHLRALKQESVQEIDIFSLQQDKEHSVNDAE